MSYGVKRLTSLPGESIDANDNIPMPPSASSHVWTPELIKALQRLHDELVKVVEQSASATVEQDWLSKESQC